ncbi:MAG: c-type cytochrome [Chromatiales bacterium]|jgi:cytochrome c5
MPRLVFCTLLLLPALVAAEPSRYFAFADEHLSQGRSIWLDNCEGCHGWGVADAPIPMQPDDWRERVVKPRGLLYTHAIEGFFGPDDSMMPAKGGNMALTDQQVQAAVDYMVELARHHIHSNQPD